VKLWRSGVVWSVLYFIGGLGNFAFSAMIARRLSHGPHGEFGYSNTTQTGFISFLSLPLSMVSAAVIHYIAHFRGRNDEARLQGLLAGCQKFLLQATIAGSLLAIVLAKPLGSFFDYRPTLMLAALIYILVNLWSIFGMALCQGMAWFKRLAVINLIAVGLRYLFGWVLTEKYPTAEMAVTATTLSLLANVSLFYWWKDIFRHAAARISPWNRDFVRFLLVAGAYVAGNWFFINGQELVAQKYFSAEDLDAYEFAARFGLALPGTVAPFLLVMFTSRSGGRKEHSDQRILLALYAAGLACGAAGLIVFRHALVRLMSGHPNPQAAAILVPFTVAMIFGGLLQAIGLWSLGSRWLKLTALYGGLGLVYWLTLLLTGHTPAMLLRVMPCAAGAAFCILLTTWLATLRRQGPVPAAA
jgi:hypothetical protein